MSSLLDRISKLEQQLVELKAEAEKEEEKNEKQNKRWRANRYENYWYVSDCGIVITEEDIKTANSAIDNYRYDTHNYFQSEEEARKYAKVLETERQLKKFADEHNGKIDWSDNDSVKYYLCYNYNYNYNYIKQSISIDSAWVRRYPRVIYFSSKEIASQAIGEIGTDKIKEYLTYEW